MKKIVSLLLWFVLTPAFLVGLLGLSYSFEKNGGDYLHLVSNVSASTDVSTTDSKAVYSQVKGISSDVKIADARPLTIAAFLEKNESPLQPYDYYGQFLTDLADKYELDVWLLPSISMQESNLCKKIPPKTYNCLGLGIHSQGTWGFDSYEENFEAAAKILKKNYIDKGYVTPDQIQDKYTPGSNGSWEFAVNYFIDILERSEI